MTCFGTDLFLVGTHWGNLLVSSRFSTGILISVSTVSHCGSPLWKNRSCSKHQCIGLLEEHCSNHIMSMLNLQIHGIKQNKLSESILLSFMLGWMTTFVCTSVYFCRICICVYEFMNKKCFSRHIWIHACASLRVNSGFPDLPFQDGHKLVVCTDSVICSVRSGVFAADSVCARLLHRLLLGSIFLNTFQGLR